MNISHSNAESMSNLLIDDAHLLPKHIYVSIYISLDISSSIKIRWAASLSTLEHDYYIMYTV